MISFVRTDADMSAILTQLGWMVGMTFIFFFIMLNPFVDRMICGFIGFVLEKCTFLGGRRYKRLLQLGNQLSISEHQFFSEEKLSPEGIQFEEGVTILAIRRRAGHTELFSSNIGVIEPGDSLIYLLGPDDMHDSFRVQ